MLPGCLRDRPEEHEMKHRLLVAFLVLAGAACGQSQIPRPEAGDEADAVAPDATVGVEVASPPDTQSPDVAADGGADGAGPAPDSSAMDSGMADLAADTLAADVGADVSPDPGAAACGNVSRQDLCTSYCDGIGRFCTGANMQFPGAEACRAACNGPTWACGKAGEMTGSSLYCRMAHMAVAGLGAAAKECPNAGPGSATCQ
jgi:hypothetical protein